MLRPAVAVAAFLPLIGLVLGCSENDLRSVQDALPPPEPEIVVTPSSLSFGEVRSADTSTRRFEIQNIGLSTLHVTDVFVETGGDAFTVLLPDEEFLLEPNEIRAVDVEFTPAGALEAFGQVVVLSDDSDEPTVPVDLDGFGATPELLISPDPYDFGQGYIPCSEDVSISLENVGMEPLVIDAIDYDSSDGQMEVFDPNSYPIVLDQYQSAEVEVVFTASSDTGPSVGTLTVDSNDPRGIQKAEQTGEGLYVARVTDDFIVPEDPPVDILFMVDQSCSMDTVTVPLGNAFNSFIGQINSVTQGWNIGVVTNDNGCFNAGMLTATSPSYNTGFQSAVSSGGCAGGYPLCETESLLGLAWTALNKTAAGQCNAGFLRPGAMLHIIFVSDEQDQTYLSWPQYTTPAQAASAGVSFYQSFVSSPNLLKVSAIADIHTACGDGTGANGYVEAAQLTGGEILDVCTSAWSSKTQDLALASLSALNEYTLSQTPDPGSLEVYIDNVLLPQTEWSYDPGTNTISVQPELEGGQDVEIEYGVAISCP